MTLVNSTLAADSTAFGGGMFARFSTISIVNSTLSGNTANSLGGGIYASSAALAVSATTLTGNTAGSEAGGIHARASTITLSSSLISGNEADMAREVSQYHRRHRCQRQQPVRPQRRDQR